MGIVRSYNQTDTTTTYKIYDPENESKEYTFIIYHGVANYFILIDFLQVDSSRTDTPIPYVEGTRVMAFGKLRYLNNEFGMPNFKHDFLFQEL